MTQNEFNMEMTDAEIEGEAKAAVTYVPRPFIVTHAREFKGTNSNMLVVKLMATRKNIERTLVFENMNQDVLENRKEIDPFGKSRFSPRAEFTPDGKGWREACFFAEVCTAPGIGY